MSLHRLAQLSAAVIICVGAYVLLQTPKPSGAEVTPADEPKAAEAVDTEPIPVLTGDAIPEKPKLPKPKVDDRLTVELPDGSRVPVLNNAYGAPPLAWPRERPWSPIVDKEHSGGLDWYRHADGSYSTTQMVFDTQRGHRVATTQVANPTKSLPMAPDEVAEIKRQEAEAKKKKKKKQQQQQKKKKGQDQGGNK